MYQQPSCMWRETAAIAALGLFLFGVGLEAAREDPSFLGSALSSDDIVQNLMAANTRRADRLRGYRSKRIYRLDYRGIFGGHAHMEVEATYKAPNEKSFKIISESGSKLLIRRVLLKLLQSEHEAQEEENRKRLEISPANYDFRLETLEHNPAGDFYVLSLTPRSRSKYVYKGKIWVDATDFAVMRMDGTPATNPSFWVSHVEIQYQWARMDGFWLPIHNYSVTDVRFGGRAVLNIDYSDYKIDGGAQGANSGKANEKTVLPDPSSLSAQPH